MKPKKPLRFVTANNVIPTGVCSFKFMFDGEMPRDWVGHGHFYGMILPFEKGEEHGQDTHIYVFESGKGQIMSGAFLARDPSDNQLRDILRDGWIGSEEIIFLVPITTFGRMTLVLSQFNADFDFFVHHFNGDLSTS